MKRRHMKMRSHNRDLSRDLKLVRFANSNLDITYSYQPLEGEYILMPKITGDIDSDVINQKAILERFQYIENFPSQIKEHFILPTRTTHISFHLTPQKREFQTLIFREVDTNDIKINDIVHLLKQIIKMILFTNNLNVYYRYIHNLTFEHLVKDSQTNQLLILAIPGSNSGNFIVDKLTDNDELKQLLHILDVRKQYISASLSLDDIDRFIISINNTHIQLPNNEETIQYSESRISQNSLNCHPVQKDNVGNYSETDENKTKRYIRITDQKETFVYNEILENEFSNFIVYVDTTDNNIKLKIAVASVNFEDIGSKHAHIVLGMLPRDFYFLFSGELIKDRDFIRYNLNSGMFYHLQLDTYRKNTLSLENFGNFHNSIQEVYLFSLFSKDLLNWNVLSEAILKSLLNKPVFLDDGGLRKLFCKVDGFSLKEYPSKHHCQIMRSGRERC